MHHIWTAATICNHFISLGNQEPTGSICRKTRSQKSRDAVPFTICKWSMAMRNMLFLQVDVCSLSDLVPVTGTRWTLTNKCHRHRLKRNDFFAAMINNAKHPTTHDQRNFTTKKASTLNLLSGTNNSKLGMHRISGRISRPFLISGIRPAGYLSGKAGYRISGYCLAHPIIYFVFLHIMLEKNSHTN
jgi:hypothetical protein